MKSLWHMTSWFAQFDAADALWDGTDEESISKRRLAKRWAKQGRVRSFMAGPLLFVHRCDCEREYKRVAKQIAAQKARHARLRAFPEADTVVKSFSTEPPITAKVSDR